MDLKIEGSILEQGIFNMSDQNPPIPAKKVSNHKVFGTDQETFSDMNMRGVGSSTNTSFSNVFEHSLLHSVALLFCAFLHLGTTSSSDGECSGDELGSFPTLPPRTYYFASAGSSGLPT